jgi:hypothetical protein
MNTNQEKAQRMIIQNLTGLELTIKNIVTGRDTYRQTLNKLAVQGGDYSQEYLERTITKTKSDYAAKMQAANTDIIARLEELRGLYVDRDSVLDLNNPAMQSALLSISTIGGALKFDRAVKINANFIHDQSSLMHLRDAYLAHDLNNAGNIDALIYNANDVIDDLEKLATDCLIYDGSINTFANKLSKLAALEGLTIEKVPDQQGALSAMRAAAGLPDPASVK